MVYRTSQTRCCACGDKRDDEFEMPTENCIHVGIRGSFSVCTMPSLIRIMITTQNTTADCTEDHIPSVKN